MHTEDYYDPYSLSLGSSNIYLTNDMRLGTDGHMYTVNTFRKYESHKLTVYMKFKQSFNSVL